MVTLEGTSHRTDGLMVDTSHFDVGCQHGIDGTITTGHEVREILEVLGITNLVDTIFLIQGESLRDSCPTE